MPDNAFTADELHGQTEEMTFAGALSFLRRKYTKDLTGAEVAITGLPFDSATSNRPGARMGPAAIRAASVQLAELKAFPSGLNLYQELAIVDYGDCYLDYGYPENVVDSIIEHTRTILAADVMAVSLGGDHFVTYPLLRAHFEKYGPLSLLHFDAHCDTWPDDGKRLDHGSMFTRAVADGLIVPEESVQVGLRTHNDKTLGFHILDAPWVHEAGVNATVDRIRGRKRRAHKRDSKAQQRCFDELLVFKQNAIPTQGKPGPHRGEARIVKRERNEHHDGEIQERITKTENRKHQYRTPLHDRSVSRT